MRHPLGKIKHTASIDMKNHFVFSYAGNKRQEVEGLYKHLLLDEIDTIVEPFMGTAAMSYYISTQHPLRYRYILSDIDPMLVALYRAMMDPVLADQLNQEVNAMIDEFNAYTSDAPRKIWYTAQSKQNTLASYVFSHKYHSIRCGLYPMMNRLRQIAPFDLTAAPIYQFLTTENVTLMEQDAIEAIKAHRDEPRTLLLLDPPYISTCNDFYSSERNMNIYEWLYHNNINNMPAHVILILENIWINRLLFQNNTIHDPYAKQYCISKKKTEHIVIGQC